MIRSHHKIKSSTDLSHHVMPSDIDNHQINHRAKQNGTIESRSYHFYPYNRYKLNGLSSEFELSTDTDDDSLIGEADSSNHMSPLDIANETLKDVEQKVREKVLNILKMLLHENVQISIKNAKLSQELRRKDDELADLLQASRRSSNSYIINNRSDSLSNSPKHHASDKYNGDDGKIIDDTIHRKDNAADERKDIGSLATIKNDSVTIHMVDSVKTKIEKSSHEFNNHLKTEIPASITVTKTISNSIPTVIEVGNPMDNNDKPATITNGTNNTISSTKFTGKSETEVIRMPLKKSVRRNLAENSTAAATTTTAAVTTVVVMQPHKLRDEARDKSCDKLDKISRNYEKDLRSLSPPPSSPIHQKHSNLVTAKATE